MASSPALPTLPISSIPLHQACDQCASAFASPENINSIFTSPSNLTGGGVTFQTVRRDVERAAAAGCPSCRGMIEHDVRGYMSSRTPPFEFGSWDSLLDEESRPRTHPPLDEELKCNVYHYHSEFKGETNVYFVLKLVNPVKFGKNLMLGMCSEYKFKMYTFPNDPMEKYLTDYIELTDRNSLESFALIRGWINECQSGSNKEHQICGSDAPVKLPTRLVEVSSMDEPESARLYCSEEHYGNYLALSYCWGGPQQYATNSFNLSDYHIRLPYNLLPSTIKDAIRVTRNCGYRYLWVDALCIVQDDHKNVDEELAKMKQIYQNADLTISAACASAATEGFLTTRTHRLSRLSVPLANGSTGCIVFERRDQEVTMHHKGNKRLRRYEEPLNNRAWTLQESLLAKRLLIYPDRGIFFRCTADLWPDTNTITKANNEACRNFWLDRKSESAETRWNKLANRLGYLVSYGHERNHPGVRTVLSLSRLQSRALTKSALCQAWLDLVEAYSERQLTLESDVLIALSALSEIFSSPLQCRYFAGVWEIDVLLGLSWMVNECGAMYAPVRKRSSYQAPSWSWASLTAPIIFKNPSYDKNAIAEFVDCKVTAASHGIPFGAVLASELVLSAPVREVKVKLNSYKHNAKCRVADPRRLELGHAKLETQLDIDDFSLVEDIITLLALWEDPAPVFRSDMSGLILKRVSETSDSYYRIGWFVRSDDVRKPFGPLHRDLWVKERIRIV